MIADQLRASMRDRTVMLGKEVMMMSSKPDDDAGAFRRKPDDNLDHEGNLR